MKGVAVLAAAVAVAAATPAAASNFQPDFGFRTAAYRVYCFMEFSGSRWTGHICFRTRDGAFAALRGPMSALKGRIRVQRGFAGAFRGYRDRRVRLFAAGRTWSSSDAQIVTCRIRVSSVTCRHYRGASFTLGF
jgi:hypothetical protein